MTAQQPERPNPSEPAVEDEGLVVDPTIPTDATPPIDADAVEEPTPDDAADPSAGADEPAESGDADAPAEADAVEPEPDWKDRYLRSVAELDNVRKRARRDAAAGEVRGVTRLAKELLPAMDNLDRAIQHVGESSDGDAQLIEGLRIVHRELHAALSQAGIEAFDPTGEEFDPRFHEAMTTAPAAEGVLPGTVTIVYQSGYRRGDDVIRAAKVVVAG
ncbi:MAG: nucleotide exchange factor GrpE [Patulibacter sp.]|nr:nucleotide exchange factor GrpE [Patulibacter sp.]